MERNTPDELVVRLAHYAGQLEESKHLNSMEWDDLASAIQDVITAYNNNPEENHVVSSIEDVAYMYFVQQFGTDEFREAAQQEGWLNASLDEMVTKAKAMDVAARPFDREEEMKSFFYTFGTSANHPFYNGYLEIQAHDRKEADALFRENYPDKIPGLINCACIYNQEEFPDVQKTLRMYPDGNVCHRVISVNEQQPRHAVALDDQIRTAQSRKTALQAPSEQKEPER